MPVFRDLIAGVVSVFKGGSESDTPAEAKSGPDTPQQIDDDLESDSGKIVNGAFRDVERQRIVPFKLYVPVKMEAAAPVVIFSHGLGGSREGASYLGHALALAGYYGVFIQHPGSDESILEGAESQEDIQARMQEAMQTPGVAIARFGDLPFVIDQLEQMNRTTRLAGRLDLDRIGMAGHSFGARGTMAAAGQRIGAYGARFKDPRVKAGVLLSPNLPSAAGQNTDRLYEAVDIPLMHITGTEDGMPAGETDFDPETRTKPYRLMNHTDQYLLVLDGANHSTFSGRMGDEEVDLHDAVALASVLFFDAYLKQDDSALLDLREEFPRNLAVGDLFEFK